MLSRREFIDSLAKGSAAVAVRAPGQVLGQPVELLHADRPGGVTADVIIAAQRARWHKPY